VSAEIVKARAKHRNIRSAHEAYAVILEELDEVWAEIKAQRYNPQQLLRELVQTAAMCQRAAEDLALAEARMSPSLLDIARADAWNAELSRAPERAEPGA
jgi:hypothetical protein